MTIQKAFRFVALLGVLAITGSLSAPKASADPVNCRVWCDSGITVQGYETCQGCQMVFANNCNQQGWYGGTYCSECGCFTY